MIVPDRRRRPDRRAAGWSKAAIRLDLLKLMNGHLTLSLGGLIVGHLHLGPTHMALALRDGAMEAHIDRIALYGGTGTAILAADGRGAVPSFRNTLSFTGIAMRPFLADAIAVDKLGRHRLGRAGRRRRPAPRPMRSCAVCPGEERRRSRTARSVASTWAR
ncbi:MAG: hypothetical protein WDM81_03070 [Rhizomicrobium sp.]